MREEMDVTPTHEVAEKRVAETTGLSSLKPSPSSSSSSSRTSNTAMTVSTSNSTDDGDKDDDDDDDVPPSPPLPVGSANASAAGREGGREQAAAGNDDDEATPGQQESMPSLMSQSQLSPHPPNECPICYETFAEPLDRCREISVRELQDSIRPVPPFSLFDDDDDENDDDDGDDRRLPEASSSVRDDDDDDDNDDADDVGRLPRPRRRRTRRCSERVVASPTCRHEFCRGCLRSHCLYAISVRAVPIICPAAPACISVLSEGRVRDLLLSLAPKTAEFDEDDDEDDDGGGRHQAERSKLNAPVPRDGGGEGTTGTSGGVGCKMSHYGSIELLSVPQEEHHQICDDDGIGTGKGEVAAETSDWEQDWIKFQRLQRMAADSTLIACVRCQELIPVPTTPSNSEPFDGTDDDDDVDVEMALSDKEWNEDDGVTDEDGIGLPQECATPKKRCKQRGRRRRTDDEEESFADNQVTCPSCNHEFCRVHGDAHPGTSCRDHARASRRAVRDEENMMRRLGCKPCSHCRAAIQKEAGCDHIVCTACHEDMCFKCGTHEFLVGESMVRTCQQCQQSYIDHRHIWTYRASMCLLLPLYLPLMVLHVAVVGAVAIATLGCFCCLGCGIRPRDSSSSSSSSSSGIVLRPILATQTVLSMVFMPAMDLAAQFGIPCCIRAPNVDGDADDDKEDGVYPESHPHQVKEECDNNYGVDDDDDDDVEIQRCNLTSSTLDDDDSG